MTIERLNKGFRTTATALVWLGAMGAAGCTPGAITSEMGKTPDIPDQEQCSAENLGSVMSPLVMEWPTAARADVESAIQDGVVVVSYSCEGIKVLQDCRVPGDYGYRAVTPKSDDALIEGSDNIRASFGGGPWSFGGNVDRAAKLDLSYMLVGKRATVRSSVHRGELEGDDFCKGATHFIKRVDIGAWTMVSGKNVTAGLAAKVMNQGIEGGSSSKEMRSKTDGDPKMCKGASRDDEGPPSGCGALIRVTMAPIKAGGGPDKGDSIAKTGAEDAAGCPGNFKYSDEGVCVADASKAKAVLCDAGDLTGCREQCKKGSNKSCNRFANIVMYSGQDRSGKEMQAVMNKELKPMMGRFEQACDDDEPAACMAISAMMFLEVQGKGEDEQIATGKKILPYVKRACVAGEPRACGFFRMTISSNKEFTEKLGIDGKASYVDLIRRGCKAGSAVPCGQLAFEKAIGDNMSQEAPKALKLASDACLGNYAQACVLRSALLSDEAGCKSSLGALDDDSKMVFDLDKVCGADNLGAVKANPAEAKRARARACSLGLDGAC